MTAGTPPPGTGFQPVAKDTTDLFKRWRTPGRGGFLRSMWNAILPVVVVDRYRDDDEGSIFAITAFTPGAAVEHPAIAWGSAVNDWELISLTVSGRPTAASGSVDVEHHLFTPIAPYNPVVNINPVGFFGNGLLTNRAFTFGTVNAIGGSNPLLPLRLGFEIQNPQTLSVAFAPSWMRLVPGFSGTQNRFDPPIRILRDVTLAYQIISPLFVAPFGLLVSILYRERPKT